VGKTGPTGSSSSWAEGVHKGQGRDNKDREMQGAHQGEKRKKGKGDKGASMGGGGGGEEGGGGGSLRKKTPRKSPFQTWGGEKLKPSRRATGIQGKGTKNKFWGWQKRQGGDTSSRN